MSRLGVRHIEPGDTVGDVIDTGAASAMFALFPHTRLSDLLLQVNIVRSGKSPKFAGSHVISIVVGTTALAGGGTASVVYSTDPRVSPAAFGLERLDGPFAALFWGEMTQGQISGRPRTDSPTWWFDVASDKENASDLPAAAQRFLVDETEFWADTFDAHAYALRLVCAAAGGDLNAPIEDPYQIYCELLPVVEVFDDAVDFAVVLEMLYPQLFIAIERADHDQRRSAAEFAASTAVKLALPGEANLSGTHRAERWRRYHDATLAADALQADEGPHSDLDSHNGDFDIDFEADAPNVELDRRRSEQNSWLSAWFALAEDDYTACVGAVHGLLASVIDEAEQARLVATLLAKL